MHALLKKEFGFSQCEIKRIDGYDNANYIVKNGGISYVFKTYNYNKELLAILEAENEALLYLNTEEHDKFPKPIPFISGESIKVLTIQKRSTICRMLSFIDGEFLGDSNPTERLFYSLGTFLAELNLKLQYFDSYVFKARQWEWDLQYFQLNKKYIEDISEPHDRSIVHYFFKQYEQHVLPVLPLLRKQVIHNDANEWNVLLKNETISGIIDFGDLAHSHLINEIAIAITYACYDKEDPLKWAPIILKAYHKIIPIKEIEISILYYLIAARLCTSVCNSAHTKKIDPANNYATSSEKNAWKMLHKWLRINPLKFENISREIIGLTTVKTSSVSKKVSERHQYISPILSLSYEKPIAMSQSAFQYMYDSYGNTYLDAYNNIPHVGHSHPTVVAAGQEQMNRLNTNTRYLYDLLPGYAAKLLSKFPTTLNKVFFVNSGSAASDLAIRLARAHTQHHTVMTMEHGYHGNTQMAIDISDYKFNNPKGQGQKDWVLKTKIPDTYNGKFKKDNAGELYATEAISQIEALNEPLAAFIAEPIVGCGGQVPLASGYLKKIYPAIRKQGGVCISDEVQTGFGRLGDHFWGFEGQEVIPDIVIIGKPMGNGHPMGAVITTQEIADSFGNGVEFFSSFGGNPVSCATGIAVLDVIENEKLQENAKIVGEHYKALFKKLQKKYDCIGDVRGNGLFLGIEIIDGDTQKPHQELAHYIKNQLRQKYILISTDGPYDNVLKTKPPLCFTKQNAEEVVRTIEDIISKRSN